MSGRGPALVASRWLARATIALGCRSATIRITTLQPLGANALKTLLVAALVSLVALPVVAQPSYHRVTGVAADDTLNVRAEPSADSADIGDIPPGAGGIEVIDTDTSGNWGRIVWEEGNGWLAMRFLEPDPLPLIDGTSLPAGLLCTGTEPFWSLRLSQTHATYSDIAGSNHTFGFAGARVAAGHSAFPVALSHSGETGGALTMVNVQICGDGMSDRDYPYNTMLVLDAAGSREFLAGCCHLPFDAGEN